MIGANRLRRVRLRVVRGVAWCVALWRMNVVIWVVQLVLLSFTDDCDG